MTKIGEKRVHSIRCRGGNIKFRAMRLETGNFSWGTEVATMKVPVLDVVYNASNNELVRTKTLVKGAIVLVDAKPFQKWYQNHYGVEIGKKKNKGPSKFAEEFAKDHPMKHDETKKKFASRQATRVLASSLDDQFSNGRLLARISSRPGQTGRVDGYVLEGRELDFYQKQLNKKKSKK
jgi:small subunit ribosomal protein S8e